MESTDDGNKVTHRVVSHKVCHSIRDIVRMLTSSQKQLHAMQIKLHPRSLLRQVVHPRPFLLRNHLHPDLFCRMCVYVCMYLSVSLSLCLPLCVCVSPLSLSLAISLTQNNTKQNQNSTQTKEQLSKKLVTAERKLCYIRLTTSSGMARGGLYAFLFQWSHLPASQRAARQTLVAPSPPRSPSHMTHLTAPNRRHKTANSDITIKSLCFHG